jgi:hypothetical protein
MEDLGQACGCRCQRIVKKREGAVGRDNGLDAGREVFLQERRHGPHFFIDDRVDSVSVFHQEGAVAAQSESGLFIEDCHDLKIP